MMGTKWLLVLLLANLVTVGCGDEAGPSASAPITGYGGPAPVVMDMGTIGQTPVDDALLALLEPACGTCHSVTFPTLASIDSWAGLESHQSDMPIVFAGDHTNSYLYYKLLGTHSEPPANGRGLIMPMGSAPFDEDQLLMVTDWIDGL